MESSTEANRRPLSVRNLSIIKKIAIWLSNKNITPNQISIMSIVFAGFGLCFSVLYHFYPVPLWLLLVPLMIQMRLLCNLFDGMVAVEGGKKTPAGELFNDVPDRIADPILILAAGFLANSTFAFDLAWCAALLAVLTAYVRVLGVSMGCEADFRGPMAKQHRMALLTFVCLLMFIDQLFIEQFFIEHLFIESLSYIFHYLMDLTLILIIIGCLLTTWRRLRGIYQLKAQLHVLNGQSNNE